MDELLVALMPPRRRVSFLLGGAVSSSMLRGDSETECLLEDVIKDGLDNDVSHPVLKAKPNALITCAPGSSYTHAETL
jgi:hypothetical protein